MLILTAVVAACAVFAYGCGSQGDAADATGSTSGPVGTAETTTANPKTVETESHFQDTKALASYLDENLDLGCHLIAGDEPPHPADSGMTAEDVGVSQETFEMQSRAIEQSFCLLPDKSVIGLASFDGHGLSVAKYEQWLQNSILPDACNAGFTDVTRITSVIWADGKRLWNVEPGSHSQERVHARSLEGQANLANEVADSVDGQVVSHNC